MSIRSDEYHSTNNPCSNISLTFSLFSKLRLARRLDLFLNCSIRGWCRFWCATTITFLSTSSKFFTECMNSIDLSSMGPISSQIMTSQFFAALLSLSAAKRQLARLTKYFPTLGPFPVIDAKTFVSFVIRSTNSNPILLLLILSSLETIPPTFSPLSLNDLQHLLRM